MKKILSYLLLVMAIGMAATVAYVSVSGLLKVFAGAGVVGLILFSTIEAAKIVATSAIHTYGKKIGWLYNSILSLFIVIAMAITSMGIYGFLSSSYKETFAKFENLEATIELLEKKRNGYQKQLDIVNGEKESVTQTITELSKGLSNNVIQYKDKETGEIITTTSSSTRRVLQNQLDRAIERQETLNTKSDELTDKVFELDNEITEVKVGDDVAAELGPLRYLADVTGMTMDEVMKYFIILLIVIGDPMAVVMVIVFNKVMKRKDDDDEPTVAKNTTVDPNEGITPEMKKVIVREELKSKEDVAKEIVQEFEDEPKEKEDDTDEWDESHALDMVLNSMVEDLDEDELTKELEDTLESEGEEQLDYDTDVEIEHEDEVIESKPEGKNYVKSIENGVSLHGEEPVEDEEIKKPINREDIKEIKEEKINRIGSNKEVRDGNTDKIYFKKRKDDKS
jgi:hypothetical protein